MTRHKALTRAAELIRLHMSTPDAEVLAALEEMAAEYADALGKALAALQDVQPQYGWARLDSRTLVANGAQDLELTVEVDHRGRMTAWRGFGSGEGRGFRQPHHAPEAVNELVQR